MSISNLTHWHLRTDGGLAIPTTLGILRIVRFNDPDDFRSMWRVEFSDGTVSEPFASMDAVKQYLHVIHRMEGAR